MIEYTVQKGNRKTITITVKADGSVQVKAPLRASARQINALLEDKADWIWQKRQEMLKKQSEKPKHQYLDGEIFWFLGQEVLLVVWHNAYLRHAVVSREENRLVVSTPITDSFWVQEAIVRWYVEEAKQVLSERTKYYSGLMDASYGRITIRDQKSRWGSCSGKGNLNFNFRLIMAPLEIVDYVVVHELCHLKYMDHSPQFWEEVEKVLPDYKNRQNWLKSHGHLLVC